MTARQRKSTLIPAAIKSTLTPNYTFVNYTFDLNSSGSSAPQRYGAANPKRSAAARSRLSRVQIKLPPASCAAANKCAST